MAAKRKATETGRSSMRFKVAPSLAWIFGAPHAGAFDSERGLVQYVLRFINGAESAVEPDPARVASQSLLRKDALARMREDYRAELRRFVSVFRSDRARALGSIPKHLLVLDAKLQWQGAHLDLWVPVDTPDKLRALFVSLLADDARGFGDALCRCRLKDCERFFLEQKRATGRPMRLYCKRTHMLAAHATRER